MSRVTEPNAAALLAWAERITHRCPRMREHVQGGCPCHPKLPIPCDECFSLRVLTQQVPYQPNVASHPLDERAAVWTRSDGTPMGHPCKQQSGSSQAGEQRG